MIHMHYENVDAENIYDCQTRLSCSKVSQTSGNCAKSPQLACIYWLL